MEKKKLAWAAVALTLAGAGGRLIGALLLNATFAQAAWLRKVTPAVLESGLGPAAWIERAGAVVLAAGLALFAVAIAKARLAKPSAAIPIAIAALLATLAPASSISGVAVASGQVRELDPAAGIGGSDPGPRFTIRRDAETSCWVAERVGTTYQAPELQWWLEECLMEQRAMQGGSPNARLTGVTVWVALQGPGAEEGGAEILELARASCTRSGARLELVSVPGAEEIAARAAAMMDEVRQPYAMLAGLGTVAQLAAAAALAALAWSVRRKRGVAIGLGALAVAEALASPATFYFALTPDGTTVIQHVAPRAFPCAVQLVVSAVLLIGGAIPTAITLGNVSAETPDDEESPRARPLKKKAKIKRATAISGRKKPRSS